MSLLSRDKRGIFLSTGAPGPAEIRLATAMAVATLVLFVGVAPLARVPLGGVIAFVPAYESWTILCLLITAALLIGQFAILRSRGLLVLVTGYLFTAFIAIVHLLTVPGVFSATGLLGAGRQTSSWLFLAWHGGFPLCVIGFAFLGGSAGSQFGERADGRSRRAMMLLSLGCGLGALGLALLLLVMSTKGANALPVLITTTGAFTPMARALVGVECGFCLIALGALFTRRSRTLLDLWLMVAMVAWLFDLALSGLIDFSRFDLGWYMGRLYGALAFSSLLVALLVESATHYSRLSELYEALMVSNRALEHLSLHDGLTGLPNRRYFDTYLGRQAALMRRHQRSLALVLCDVDSFKAYNDSYGHQAGDECLTRIAIALRSCCRRPADMAARYGGEEFALVLPETDLEGALRIAEAAREAVARLRIPHASGLARPFVTFSGGVAIMDGSTEVTVTQLLATADEGLFQAKRHGRNCIVAASLQGPKAIVPVEPFTTLNAIAGAGAG